MSDEKPVPLKKLKRGVGEQKGRFCIVHYDRNKADLRLRPRSDVAFQAIKETVAFRNTLLNPCHRLEDICRNVPQIYDAEYHGIHRWCYKNFTNTSTARVTQTFLRPIQVVLHCYHPIAVSFAAKAVKPLDIRQKV